MGQYCPDAVRTLMLLPLLAGCVTTTVPRPADVPEPLRAPPGQVLSITLHATGVQIYECKPSKDDGQRFDWQLRAPEAELLDQHRKAIGKHYAGPAWEANDGSKVVGEVVARVNAPESTAIPWLLLRAISATGQGMLGKTQSIQRLHTVGGKAPAGGCDQSQSGALVRVPYSADYLFFR